MEMNARGIYTYTIEAQDIDFRRRVSLASLTNFVLITAGRNANENGFGLLELQTGNYTWVPVSYTHLVKTCPLANPPSPVSL